MIFIGLKQLLLLFFDIWQCYPLSLIQFYLSNAITWYLTGISIWSTGIIFVDNRTISLVSDAPNLILVLRSYTKIRLRHPYEIFVSYR